MISYSSFYYSFLEVLLIFPFAGDTSFPVVLDFDLSFIKVDLELTVFAFVCLSDAAEVKLF